MVIAGSIRAARSAGIQHAPIPIAAIITATPINVIGSCGATPKSSPRMTRAAKKAPATPSTRPIASSTPPLPQDHPLHPAAVGPEAHANADLVGARAHRERQHAGDPHRRDDHRQDAERRDERGIQTPRRHALILDLRHGHHVLDRSRRRDAPDDARRRRRQADTLLSARITSPPTGSPAPARTA